MLRLPQVVVTVIHKLLQVLQWPLLASQTPFGSLQVCVYCRRTFDLLQEFLSVLLNLDPVQNMSQTQSKLHPTLWNVNTQTAHSSAWIQKNKMHAFYQWTFHSPLSQWKHSSSVTIPVHFKATFPAASHTRMTGWAGWQQQQPLTAEANFNHAPVLAVSAHPPLLT